MPGETGRIFLGVYYVAYIFMDSRSVGVVLLVKNFTSSYFFEMILAVENR
jgi:hypothetical protein